jgi:hypothetical protein
VISRTLLETVAVGVLIARSNPGDGLLEPVRPQVELANRQTRTGERFDTEDDSVTASDWDYIGPFHTRLLKIS